MNPTPPGTEYWQWAPGLDPRTGPTVCVDIDGVLSDGRHRQHLVNQRPKDWPAFFRAAADDSVIDTQAHLLDQFADDRVIALVTSRPEWVRSATTRWLIDHDIRWDLLAMRPDDDGRPSPQVKSDVVEAMRAVALDPVFAIDDDPRNVLAYAEAGVPCLYVHSGYHSRSPR